MRHEADDMKLAGTAFVAFWVAMLLVHVVFFGVIIWGIIKLVGYFTGGGV